MDMSSPVEEIKGIGPKTAEALHSVGITSIGDLLYRFPRAYENYQSVTSISDLSPGKIMVRGKISDLRTTRTSRRGLSITKGVIRDSTGLLNTVWFNQPYRAKQFDPDREYFFTGNYDLKYGKFVLTSPTAVLASDVDSTSQCQPIYPQRSALKPQAFRKMLASLKPFFANIPDLLPLTSGAPSYVTPGARAEALYQVHFPDTPADVESGRRYLAYEELFELSLATKLNRLENTRLPSPPMPFDVNFIRPIVENLPFPLTGAQRRAAWEIIQELERATPMNRLLQGDVGSGKTIVAALAAASAAHCGFQTVILAPTAILASQHFESLSKLFSDLSPRLPNLKLPRLALLISATSQKPKLKTAIASGEIDIVIGTHAVLTDDTRFHSLGLCIIDEQHRFGVAQRQKLLLKSPANTAPHLLSMTATPIPRSLHLAILGDIDTSILNELPAGRKPITTKILPEIAMRDDLYPAMRELLATKQQIYWICRSIEDEKGSTNPADAPASISVQQQAKKLAAVFPKCKIGILHGKMRPADKDAIMASFASGEIDILVSTTVVEVGVNVPNANMIIINDAERFGLAQLHQLRGRVGRGDRPASCYLLIDGESSPSRRLKEMEKSTDGFHLAEVDLKLRGPGEVYGVIQHGELDLQFANLGDTRTIAEAGRHVAEFVKHPEDMIKYKELAERIKKYQQLTTLN